ncbi:hypothetical protein K1719_019143 [Acacia pycnantha]|nr:hypothetical protein K1719_019143 [Acacia pycnantha]
MEGILSEGASINRPPGFDGEHYSFWKAKFRVFVLAMEYGLWQVIENGDYVPTKIVGGNNVPKAEDEFNEDDRRKVTLNSKAILMLHSALSQKEYSHICNQSTAKEMWKALETSYEGTSVVEEEETANICLVAEEEQSENEEEVCDSEPSYYELFSEYNELHYEFKKIVKELFASRKKIKLLEQQVKDLPRVSVCENSVYEKCLDLEKKNSYLTKTLEKFTKGSEMLNSILKAQRFTNDRSGIGYNPTFDKKKGKKKTGGKYYLNYFQKLVHSSNPFAHCNYCNRKGHSTSSCFHRKDRRDKPVGNYQWVPKGTYVFPKAQTNSEGPKYKWVPKSPSFPLCMQTDFKNNRHKGAEKMRNQRASYEPKRRSSQVPSRRLLKSISFERTLHKPIERHKRQWVIKIDPPSI